MINFKQLESTFYIKQTLLSDLPSGEMDLIKVDGCLDVAASLLVVVVGVGECVGVLAATLLMLVARAAVSLVVLRLLRRSRIWHKW